MAWQIESDKFAEQAKQQREAEAQKLAEEWKREYSCLTHLKIGENAADIDKCGVTPDHTNSDLRGEQQVYHIGTATRYFEVLVYVDTKTETVDNVQWDDKPDSED